MTARFPASTQEYMVYFVVLKKALKQSKKILFPFSYMANEKFECSIVCTCMTDLLDLCFDLRTFGNFKSPSYQ